MLGRVYLVLEVTLYKSWIHPVLEYDSILYSGTALTHLKHLDCFQTHVENMCGITFPSLTKHHNASIFGLTCRLLAGEGRGNLQSFCPEFRSSLLRTFYRLHSFDPARHLCLHNPFDFGTLDRFHHSWQGVVTLNLRFNPGKCFIERGQQRMEECILTMKVIQTFYYMYK